MAEETRRSSDRPRRRRRLRVGRAALVVALLLSVASLGAAAGYVVNVLQGIPASDPESLFIERSSFIYDRNCDPANFDPERCKPVAQIHGPVHRVPVELGELPEYVPNAFIAIEDERFFQHPGVDLRGIVRALWANLRSGEIQEGASTITQQLARHLFPIGQERTLKRKLQEAYLSIQLERRYNKRQILEMYLNQIYFGRGAYGIEAAAMSYFGKHARELELHEAALLAAVVKGPGPYGPDRHPEAALARRNLVLDAMAKQGFITPEQARQAKEKPLEVQDPKNAAEYQYPYFVDYVIQQLLDHFAEQFEKGGLSPDEARERAAQLVYSGGLHIFTTVDPQVQQAAEEAVAEVMQKEFPAREGEEPVQAALAAVEPATGEILALVGGREHDKMLGFNRAWQALRQPGSAMKPVAVYAAAFEAGLTPGTVVDDAPVQYTLGDRTTYFPRNFDNRFKGLMTIREAVRNSVNAVAVKVLHDIGVERGFEMARRLGVDTLDDNTKDDGKSDLNLSLALGGLTKGVSPLDMAQAYAVFASGGVRSEPYAIRRVQGPDGRVLLENRPKQEAVLSPQVAWVMTDVLRNVVSAHRIPRAGTGAPARPADRRPAAGKTGTTTNKMDVWFVGYTPDISSAVWIGYDKERELPARSATGASVWGGTHAGRIWKLMIDKAFADRPKTDFQRPNGIVEATICSKDGKLPGPYCPDEYRYTEVFVRGTEPTEVGNIFKPFPVCAENPKLLYQQGCGCTPVEKVFLDRPRVEPFTYTDPRTGRTATYTVEDMALAPPSETCTGFVTSGRQQFRFRVTEDNFEPRVVMGAMAGQEVRFVVEAAATDVVFTLPDLGVEASIPAGEVREIRFTPLQDGTYTFYFDNGRFLMPGKLVVHPAAGGGGGDEGGGGGETPPGGDSGGGDGGGDGDDGNGD